MYGWVNWHARAYAHEFHEDSEADYIPANYSCFFLGDPVAERQRIRTATIIPQLAPPTSDEVPQAANKYTLASFARLSEQ